MSNTPKELNIARFLRQAAQRHPEKRAVVAATGRGPGGRMRYAQLSFAELERDSDEVAFGLERAGLRPGMRVVLLVPSGIEFTVLTFALLKTAAVIVLVDPGMGVRRMAVCIREMEPGMFIGVARACLACGLFRWAPGARKILVSAGGRAVNRGRHLSNLRRPTRQSYAIAPMTRSDTAGIFFTSGSTGTPKGVVYTHANLDAQITCLKEIFRYRPDDVDLATFPLFALFDPAIGITAVFPDMDASRPIKADPRKILDTISDQGCTQMFASPALLRKLSQHGQDRQQKIPTIARAISAGAPVWPDLVQRFASMLSPEAEIFTPYGATEALPVTSITGREILSLRDERQFFERGTCVGRPVSGIEVYIIPVTDEPVGTWADELALDPGQVGEITVKGPTVTEAYYRRPEQDRLAKIKSRNGREIYHRMGDLGLIDAEGRLWFCGRKSHRVVTTSGTLLPVPCERVFNQHPDVLRTALVGSGPPGRQHPVLCVEPVAKRLKPTERQKISVELAVLGKAFAHTRSIEVFLFHKKFPVDVRHNSKIDRPALARWASKVRP